MRPLIKVQIALKQQSAKYFFNLCFQLVVECSLSGENIEQITDHLVFVVAGFVPMRPLLSSLGFVDAGNRRGTLVDCGVLQACSED